MKAVFTTLPVLSSSYRPVYVPGKIEKAVCTPVRTCEDRIALFMCRKRSTKYILSLWRSGEARIGLFMCRERSTK